MQYRTLGASDIEVSLIGLGTMTWGEQNSEAEAHEQLDIAVDHGVNFIDAAEIYPVPPRAETQGRTERYLGNWLARRTDRERLVIATKVSGDSTGLEWIRSGPRLNARQIRDAVDASLERLRTDTIDLYQIHWPARPANYFGRLGYNAEIGDAEGGAVVDTIEETLQTLAGLIEAGKIRAIGVSNETPWGMMQYLGLADRHGLPRVASIQNPYSLLNRSFEIGLAEFAHRERTGLLAYSPLGFGTLSGKYLAEPWPAGSRLRNYPRFARYLSEPAQRATRAYVELARQHGLSPARMALAYVHSRPFTTSTLIGATTRAQLEEDLASIDQTLDAELLTAIEAIHTDNPLPAP